jgi:hypothetical protein
MSIILRPKNWTNKPPKGAQVNFGHPLAKGLSLLLLYNEGSGVPRDLLGVNNPVENGGPTWGTSSAGLIKNVGTSANWQFANGNFLALDRVTILCIRRKTDTTERSAALFAGTVASGTTHLAAYPPFSDGIVYWDFGGNSGTNRLTWGGYVAGTKPEFWAFRAGGQGMSIWFNGKKVATQSTAVTRTGNDANYFINRLDFGANGGDSQDLAFFAVYKAELPDSAIQQWTVSPYSMLVPKRTIQNSIPPPVTRAFTYSVAAEKII